MLSIRARPDINVPDVVMSRILGLDVGDVRVGTALSDEHGTFAFPHKVLRRARGEAEAQLIQLIAEHGISTVVVGIPLTADGGATPQSAKVENFCRRLQRRTNIEVVYIDEYLSSQAAADRLAEAGKARHDIEEIDAQAAAIILQEYLDRLNQVSQG